MKLFNVWVTRIQDQCFTIPAANKSEALAILEHILDYSTPSEGALVWLSPREVALYMNEDIYADSAWETLDIMTNSVAEI